MTIDNLAIIEAKNRLIAAVKKYNPQANQEKIEKACDVANEAHKLQFRASGEPYILHPIAVAEILAELKLDTVSIVTALLHDTIEDTKLTIEDIERTFGKEVSKLVDGVTKLGKLHKSGFSKQAENFRKLLLAISKDIRVLLVKLADRLHNMRTLSYFKNEEKRLRIARETIEIYAPLAERIGIHKFKDELQDLSFAELYPEVRKSIQNRLYFLRKEDTENIDNTVKEIKKTIKNINVKAEIYGREKTSCSIWRKMEHKKLGFEQLSDIIAFRILVKTVQDCYSVLGAIHAKYHMIPGGFKDYISTPKMNGYQSLHTLVMGPKQRSIEIQIRTYDMHDVAELGVAAHWKYKQGAEQSKQGIQLRWIREILEILENTTTPEEFLENTKLEMHYDHVFCFTPKGKLIALPINATPVDFAFAVHSNLGLHCVGAKINGKIMPLKTKLENGDQVEILSSNTVVASPSWEGFVITGKARSEIKKFVRHRKKKEFINLGKSLLYKEFQRIGVKFEVEQIQTSLKHFKCDEMNDLYTMIGDGTVKPTDVIELLYPNIKTKKASGINLLGIKIRRSNQYDKKNPLPVKGLIPGMAVHFSHCCNPLPGDRIVGVMNSGKGINIHTVDCDNIVNISHPSRLVDVSWDDKSEQIYVGRINITISNEPGSFAKIFSHIYEKKINVSNIKMCERSLDFFEVLIDLDIKELEQLNELVMSLRSFSNVYSVKRVKY